ncbi:MAG: hypothetical protein R3B54_10025 [Bdellovibrionota bacterium]
MGKRSEKRKIVGTVAMNKKYSMLRIFGYAVLLLALSGCAAKENGVWFLEKIVDGTTSPATELNFNSSDGKILYFDNGRVAELDLRLGTVRCRFRAYENKDDVLNISQSSSCTAEEFRQLELTANAMQLSRTSDPRNQIVHIYSKKTNAFLDQLLSDKGLSRNDL